jgi:CRP/FNR family transcriptional regulator, cyclic AMP receptor protein
MVMGLSEADRQFLLEHAALRRFARGQSLFQQGDDATCAFLVVAGEVEIFVENYQGRTVIARKETGELFGEFELLGGQDRIASAVTVKASVLGVIRKCAFERCIGTRPELLTAILRDLAVVIGEMTLRLSTLSLNAYGRLRFCLSRLARETGDIAVVEGHWTQQQLAELAGCRRETVAKIMSELKRGEWIRSEKQRIAILRPLPEYF